MGKLKLALLVSFLASTTVHAENINQLKSRINFNFIKSNIEAGDRGSLSILPVTGFKNGLFGLMNATNTYPNPEHSFIECYSDSIVENNVTHAGCKISIKLAKVDFNGEYHDTGIRVEYGIKVGAKDFKPNNSRWAEHAINDPKFLKQSLL